MSHHSIIPEKKALVLKTFKIWSPQGRTRHGMWKLYAMDI